MGAGGFADGGGGILAHRSFKALGNLRHAKSAGGLKAIADTALVPEYRWIAHWSYERAENVTVPYVPATDVREPPVMISDPPR